MIYYMGIVQPWVTLGVTLGILYVYGMSLNPTSPRTKATI